MIDQLINKWQLELRGDENKTQGQLAVTWTQPRPLDHVGGG